MLLLQQAVVYSDLQQRKVLRRTDCCVLWPRWVLCLHHHAAQKTLWKVGQGYVKSEDGDKSVKFCEIPLDS